MLDAANEDDRRLEALVERIQAACAGEERYLVTTALTEELAEALLRSPVPQRTSQLDFTLALIRQYVREGRVMPLSEAADKENTCAALWDLLVDASASDPDRMLELLGSFVAGVLKNVASSIAVDMEDNARMWIAGLENALDLPYEDE